MKKLLKFDRTKYKYVFLSDLHIGHDREFLWKPRGFKTVQEHDDFIFKNWNEHIDDNTIVFNLGDATFMDADSEKFERLSKMECKEHYLLWGNHCSGQMSAYKKSKDLMGYSKDLEVYPLKHNNVTFVGNDMCVRFGKKIEIHLSHFAKRIWDHVGYGAIHLSGHSHSNDPERLIEHKKGKCMDVGVENSIRYNGNIFFTLDEILNIMETKERDVKDHHNNQVGRSS